MSAKPGRSIDVIGGLCADFPDRDCMADRVATTDDSMVFAAITYRRFWERVVGLASAWMERGMVAPGQRIAICGDASTDWMVVDVASLYCGGVLVPLSANLPIEDIAYILAEVEPVLLVCSGAHAPLMRPLAARCDSVRGMLLIDGGVAGADALPEWTLAEVEATPCAPRPAHTRADDALVGIVYTSGGTGRPKGVPGREGRWRAGITVPRTEQLVTSIGYLPLSHVMGRGNIVYGCLALGGTVYFLPTQDFALVLRAARVVRPTFLTFIPALSNFIYQQFRAEVAARLPSGADAHGVVAVERAVMAELRRTLLGDRLLSIRTGSAPTAPEVRRVLGGFAQVLDMYASSELGYVAINDEVLSDIEFRLEDVPELGYTRADQPYPRGELLVRSGRSLGGYYKRPDATKQHIESDGFVRTGDIFEQRGPRRITWIDRRSAVLKLAQGEFVALSRLEHLFVSSCPHIEQLFLYGNSERDHLLAVIVPAVSISSGDQDGAAIKARLRQEIGLAARRAALAGFEVPRDFLVERDRFTVDNQLLTDAGKLRRPALKAKYEVALEALYARIAERRGAAVAPSEQLTLLDQVLAVVASTLGLPRSEVDAERSFVALGGDSLGAASVATQLEALLGRAPVVGSILDRNSTLAALSRQLDPDAAGDEGGGDFGAIHPHGEREARADELRLERFLSADLAASRRPATARPRTWLLTGGNGF